MTRASKVGMWLLLLTAALVAAGCVIYLIGGVGWAQLCWVMASGTAGAGIVLFVERK